MIAAALLASPFLLDYDLVLLGVPLAFAAREGLREGFRPWEKTILFAAFVLPAVSRSVAALAGVPLGPIVIAGVLIVVLGRATAPREAAVAPRRADPDPAPAAHPRGRESVVDMA